MYDSCEGFPIIVIVYSALSGNNPVVPPNPQKVSDCLHWQELMNGLAESEGEKFFGSQPTMAVRKSFLNIDPSKSYVGSSPNPGCNRGKC